MLENGVNMIYIRDFLGHSSVVTTEMYAKASPELYSERAQISKVQRLKSQIAASASPYVAMATPRLSFLAL